MNINISWIISLERNNGIFAKMEEEKDMFLWKIVEFFASFLALS